MANVYSPEAIAYYRAVEENSPYSAKAAAYYQGRPYISAELPISQLVEFNTGRQQARLGYETGRAQEEFNRNAATALYNLDKGQMLEAYKRFTVPNLTHKWKGATDQLYYQFADRGMSGSGLEKGGRSDLEFAKGQEFGQAAFEHESGLSKLDTDYYLKIAQSNLSEQALARSYWEAVSQINNAESAARMDLAAQIRAFA